MRKMLVCAIFGLFVCAVLACWATVLPKDQTVAEESSKVTPKAGADASDPCAACGGAGGQEKKRLDPPYVCPLYMYFNNGQHCFYYALYKEAPETSCYPVSYAAECGLSTVGVDCPTGAGCIAARLKDEKGAIRKDDVLLNQGHGIQAKLAKDGVPAYPKKAEFTHDEKKVIQIGGPRLVKFERKNKGGAKHTAFAYIHTFVTKDGDHILGAGSEVDKGTITVGDAVEIKNLTNKNSRFNILTDGTTCYLVVAAKD